MEENLVQEAINLALNCKWIEAIKANLVILKNNGEDVDALNRLAKAYHENGNTEKARKASKDVLKIDPVNKIAINSLERYKQSLPIRGKNGKSTDSHNIGLLDFIEEPGKTKLTSLINLGSPKVYSSLDAGDEVLLSPHAHKVSVTNMKGSYIGKLTDDISARLRLLIKGGNKYKVLIKSVSKNSVRVFIKGDCVSFPRETLESVGEFSS